jgi:hypothetical protein
MNLEEEIRSLMEVLEEDSAVLLERKEKEIVPADGESFWGTTVLTELYPYDMERSGLRRGKLITREPANKENKFEHIKNREGKVVAIYGYTAHYDQPSQYVLIEEQPEREYVYCFDISRELEYIQLSHTKDGRESTLVLQKNGNYMLEKYEYDTTDRIISILRTHKDVRKFRDASHFPGNMYESRFVLKYANQETEPSEILWDGNPQKELRDIVVK